MQVETPEVEELKLNPEEEAPKPDSKISKAQKSPKPEIKSIAEAFNLKDSSFKPKQQLDRERKERLENKNLKRTRDTQGELDNQKRRKQ